MTSVIKYYGPVRGVPGNRHSHRNLVPEPMLNTMDKH